MHLPNPVTIRLVIEFRIRKKFHELVLYLNNFLSKIGEKEVHDYTAYIESRCILVLIILKLVVVVILVCGTRIWGALNSNITVAVHSVP